MKMSKMERVMAAVSGQEVDRVPVGFWYHFALDNPSGKELAQAELDFVEKYDPDFIKVMHDLKLDLPEGMTVIENPEDWYKLTPLDPCEGNFAQQLKTLRYIRKGQKEDICVIDTVFGPYASANKLCGKKLVEHMRENPEAVKFGLRTIAVSLTEYARTWIESGGDGIFFALDGSQSTNMSMDEYAKTFIPLDHMVLDTAMKKGKFNVLHVHGTGISLDVPHHLPCHVINWSDRTAGVSLSDGRKLTKKCIAGGINEVNINSKTPDEVKAEALSAIDEAGELKFILACGCAVPTDIPEANLHAIRQAVEK
ncbi:MAG: uroporphyrinogen decarboxylase family protein [Armatimonadota bacterium]